MQDLVSQTIAGVTTSSDEYGADYAEEFRRVLATYASGSRSFLEWGAGYTTQLIAEQCARNHGDLFLTMDENAKYLNDVTRPLAGYAFLRSVAMALKGPCVSDRDEGLNYSTYPLSLRRKFDFIFIDGRRRMECALMARLMSHKDTIVVLHDYRRARYQPIRMLFDIVEDGSQFRVMKVRVKRRGVIA
jgi:predicted O-methyltransferase YrrM